MVCPATGLGARLRKTGMAASLSSADLDLGVAGERIGRDRQVRRRGTLADAAGRVVHRAVAGAEPAVDTRPALPSGTQPRWVQLPKTISHCALPALTRAASGCGSRSEATFTSSAALISFGVRCRTKIGLPRQNSLTICPSATGAQVEIDRSASGDGRRRRGPSGSTNGQSVAAAPTAPTAPVAMKRKSRRVVGPAEMP